jgi:hypothetical protein
MSTQLSTAAQERKINPVTVAEEAHRALMAAVDPAEIIQIEAKLNTVEKLMRDTGLYPLEEIRPVNEERMRARWCLGIALMSFVRGTGRGRGKKVSASPTPFRAYLKQINLDKGVAHDAQRIGALPDKKFQETIEQ